MQLPDAVLQIIIPVACYFNLDQTKRSKARPGNTQVTFKFETF